ncbi:MAG: hypothetical protein MUE73_03140 [Planctomycetes bacterium]|nr:hypothetical protein [Planctomycetota bacterium]
MAVVLGLGALLGIDESPPLIQLSAAGGWDMPGAAALAALLLVLAASYRRPEPALVAALVLARAAAGAGAAFGLVPPDAWSAVLSAATALPLLPLVGHFPSTPPGLRRSVWREVDPALLLPAGILGCLLPGLLRVLAAMDRGILTWHHPAGLLLATAVLAVAAFRARQAWAAGVAAILLLVAGPAAAGALSFGVGGSEAALGAAAGVALLAAAVRLAARRERSRAVFTTGLDGIATCAGLVLLFWIAFRFMDIAIGAEPGTRDPEGFLLAIAAALAGGGLRLSSNHPAGLLSGLFAGLFAVAVVRGLGWSHDLYPLALGAAAFLALGTARGRGTLHAATVVLAAVALVVAAGMAIDRGDRPAPLLAGFLLAAAAGRVLAPRRPRAGGALLLVALLGAVTFGLWHGVLRWPGRWQPMLILGFTALALLAPRVKVLGVARAAARGVALPILLAAGFALLLFAGSVAAEEWTTFDTPDPRLAAVAAAAAFVLAAALFARAFRPLGRAVATAAAAALAVFVLAPVNIAIAGDFGHWRRPDVEVALCGLLLVFLLPREKGRGSAIPYAFAAVALGLTAGDFRHLSTPLTFLAVTTVALALLSRDGRRIHGDFGAFALLATALAFVVYAVPSTGRPAHEVLCVLSLAAAGALLLLSGITRLFRLRIDPARAEAAAPAFARAAAVAAVAAIAFLLLNVLSLPYRRAEADLTACAAAAMLLTAGASLSAAFAPGRAHFLHATTAALLALYAFLSARTGALDLLHGHHADALAVIGAALIGATAAAGGRFRRPLGIQGLLLPIPAVFWSLLGLAESIGTAGEAASGFFLTAAAYGIGAVRFRRRFLGVLAAVLLNLALFALWRSRGIVDPAFYGVPPGLTLLLSAEVLRGRVDRSARLALFIPGAALLYGSVGIQVLRVEEPAHALVLFGLGLVAVVLGFARGRNEFLVAGTSVVVLDVVAWLAKHGLEEGFLGALLLVLAGLTVLTVGTLAALRRRRAAGPPE